MHKGIRAILNHPRAGQIESVYDLALLIVNQCSTVFFDRTKPVDERPELLDIFSNALSHIVSPLEVIFSPAILPGSVRLVPAVYVSFTYLHLILLTPFPSSLRNSSGTC